MDELVRLYRSDQLEIRKRSANLIVKREDASLDLLLEIFESGLGERVDRALARNKDPMLVDQMLRFLRHPNRYFRTTACDVLGNIGSHKATRHIIPLLTDCSSLVRWQAAITLGRLADPSAREALVAAYHRFQDDVNMELQIGNALRAIGVDTGQLT